MIGLERIARFTEARRKAPDRAPLLLAPVEDVPVDGAEPFRGRVDLLRDAVEARHQLGREREVDVARCVRRAELEARGVFLVGVLGHADRRRAVAEREDRRDRRFEAGHEAAVRVRARVRDREQRGAVLEDASNVVEREFVQAAVAGRLVEDVAPCFAQHLVEVHAAPGLAVQRLRHEGRGLAVPTATFLIDVLDDLGRVAGAQEHRAERRLDLALSRAADLVVVVLDRDADVLELDADLAAEVVQRVFRRDRVVAAMERDAGGRAPPSRCSSRPPGCRRGTTRRSRRSRSTTLRKT